MIKISTEQQPIPADDLHKICIGALREHRDRIDGLVGRILQDAHLDELALLDRLTRRCDDRGAHALLADHHNGVLRHAEGAQFTNLLTRQRIAQQMISPLILIVERHIADMNGHALFDAACTKLLIQPLEAPDILKTAYRLIIVEVRHCNEFFNRLA